MPLARIITSTPSAAEQLAQALSDSGYIVDIVSPYKVPAGAVDLEINLDLQHETSAAIASARSTDFEQVIADPEHPYPDDPELPADYVVEREFVLAPMWRKLTAQVRDRWSTYQSQRSPKTANTITEFPADSRVLRARNMEARHRAPRHFSNAQTSAARTAQRIREHSRRMTESALAGATQAKSKVALLTSEFAARVQASRAKAHSRVSQPDANRDRFNYRQLWPIAAGVSLAFIVGFVSASYTKMPVAQVEQTATEYHGVTVVANPVHAATLRKPRAARTVLPKSNAAATRGAVYDPDAEDVVVRHYPSKTTTAKQNQGPKQYSDLE
jgi:hypothetical protein